MYAVTVTPFSKKVRVNDLTYFTAKDIAVGMVVSIAVRKKIYDGIVTHVDEVSAHKEEIKGANFQLRKIDKIKGPSVFHPEYLKLCERLTQYYLTALPTILGTLVPQPLLENYSLFKKSKKELIEKNNSNLKQEKLIFQASEEDRISWYKTFIRESFARKKSVFIVLPTIADIDRFAIVLSKGIENYTLIFHGDLAKKDLVKRYNTLIEENHPILIVGTTPFLSLPRSDISTIIVEHESSTAYKTVSDPHIDLRLFAELWSEKLQCKFIFGDTLLRIETLYRYYNQEFLDVRLPTFRMSDIKQQEIILIKKQEPDEKRKPFTTITPRLREVMDGLQDSKDKLFLFTLRNGLSTVTFCKDCKSILACEYCGSPLVLYKHSVATRRIFICNKCHKHKPSDSVCATCGSWNLVPHGIGIEYVYEELKTLYPKVPIFRIDRESVKTQKQAEKVAEEFYKTNGSILLGTELALSYLDEPVAISAVSSFDSLFNIPSFRMSERIVHLVLMLHERTEKLLLIQTRNEDDALLKAIGSGSLLEWYRAEIDERIRFNYPPASTVIKVTKSVSTEKIAEELKCFETDFAQYSPDTFKGFTSTNRKGTLVHMVLRIPKKQWSFSELGAGGELDPVLVQKLKNIQNGTIIEIDPEDLL